MRRGHSRSLTVCLIAASMLLPSVCIWSQAQERRYMRSEYYPIDVQLRRTVTDSDGRRVVLSYVRVDDNTFEIHGVLNEQKVHASTLLISKEGLSLKQFRNGVLDPPPCYIKNELVPGDDWSVECKYGDNTVTIRFHVGMETITTPLGKFETVYIQHSWKGAGSKCDITNWLAKGIGPVKTLHNENGRSRIIILEKIEWTDKDMR